MGIKRKKTAAVSAPKTGRFPETKSDEDQRMPAARLCVCVCACTYVRTYHCVRGFLLLCTLIVPHVDANVNDGSVGLKQKV